MAGTNWTLSNLLGDAGHMPETWGAEIILDLPNTSVFMGQGQPSLVESYLVPPGEAMAFPVMDARTVTARTRGSGGHEGDAIVLEATSADDGTFTNRFAYNALAIGYEALNLMSPQRLSASLMAHRDMMLRALANDVDTRLLNLYSSSTATDVGSGAVDFTIGNLADAIKQLKVANAPEPYYAVLPSTQWDHLAQSDELTRFDIRGEGETIRNGTGFRYQGVDILTTGNVPTASNIAHGLVFSKSGIRLMIRDFPVVKEWDDPDTLSMKLALYIDYSYALVQTDWAVDFQTVDT